jgi:uncharacterized protein (DUF302 family)
MKKQPWGDGGVYVKRRSTVFHSGTRPLPVGLLSPFLLGSGPYAFLYHISLSPWRGKNIIEIGEAMMEEVMNFAFSTVLDTGYDDAVSRVTDALKEEGFGVLTEIDVKETFKKKLDKEFRKYVILGACNPPYAYRSLEADLNVGLLLPCNVIVYETDDNKAYVAAINPVSALEAIHNRALKDLAEEVSEKLKRVIEKVG